MLLLVACAFCRTFFVRENSQENLNEQISPDQLSYILAVLSVFDEVQARKEKNE